MKFNRLFSAQGLSTWMIFIALAGLTPLGWADDAESEKAATVDEPTHSALTGPLFYEILLGEIEAQNEQNGNGFSLLLDAARRSKDSRLYARALAIALRAHAGESALQAASQWQEAEPDSREANHNLLQVLVALNRVSESKAALEREIKLAPSVFKPAVMANIPQMYANVSYKKEAAELVAKVLKPVTTDPTLSLSAWLTIARMQAMANEPQKAFQAIQAASKASPENDLPVLLAFARALVESQRFAQAEQQAKQATQMDPELADAWLLLGVLQSQDNAALQAEQSLTTYLSLVTPKLAQNSDPAHNDTLERATTQAYLALAQLAEQRQDFAAAEKWMSQINRPQDLLAVQARRASLLAAQGHLEEGLRLIQSVPDTTPDEARGKLFAQVQLLRNNGQTARAFDLLAQASAANPEDMDLVYEQALLAEKLKRYDQMESLLRTVMAKQPSNQSAFNALGYSLADRGIRLDEARELVTKALALAPDDPFIVDSLGWVEFKAGHLELAAKLLKQAFQQKEDPEIAAHLGEVLWRQDDQAQAKSIWQRGLTLSPKNETLLDTLTRLGVKL